MRRYYYHVCTISYLNILTDYILGVAFQSYKEVASKTNPVTGNFVTNLTPAIVEGKGSDMMKILHTATFFSQDVGCKICM